MRLRKAHILEKQPGLRPLTWPKDFELCVYVQAPPNVHTIHTFHICVPAIVGVEVTVAAPACKISVADSPPGSCEPVGLALRIFEKRQWHKLRLLRRRYTLELTHCKQTVIGRGFFVFGSNLTDWGSGRCISLRGNETRAGRWREGR